MTDTATTREIEVLLVEDNPGDRRLTAEAFHDSRFPSRIAQAGDGIEALELLEGRAAAGEPLPDLLVLDLNMPRMDGHELLERLKADERFRRLPVVVLSTSKAEGDVLRSYDLHAACHVVKPVMLDEFYDAMDQIKAFWARVAELPA